MSYWFILFCYIFVAYGACNVIVFGSGPFKIFEKIRQFAQNINEHFGLLFSCMMCMPTNFGIFCSLFNWFLIDIKFTPFCMIFNGNPELWWLAMLCDGAFTSGVVWVIHHIEEFFENIAEGNVGNGKNNSDDVIYIENE